MLTNVRDFDAAGDGSSDDRGAIQRAIDHAVANNTGGILIPAGTYRVSRVDVVDGRWSLDLNGIQGFMVAGEGPKSVIKLVDTTDPAGTGDWHVFILRNNCRRIVFEDLVIDGNRTGLTNPAEQTHGIEVEPGTEDLVIDRCILRECFGDGMRLLGAPDRNVRRLRVENSLFQKNKRSGLAIQRALEQIIITNCHFDATVTDQCIDIEPSGVDAPTEIVIHGCTINHTNQTPAVTISGIGGVGDPQPLARCKFTDNIITGGNLFCTDVNQLTVQNNTIRVTALGNLQRIPIHIALGGDSVVVTGNLLINDDPVTKSVISLEGKHEVKRALVANNLCFARAGIGIQCLSSDDVAIDGNIIVATGLCNNGILLRSESSAVENVSIGNNDITVQGLGKWQNGIRVAADPHPIGYIAISGNSIRSAERGIKFEGSKFQHVPVCAVNRIGDDVSSPLVGIRELPFSSIVVGGVVSQGGGRVIVGHGDPNVAKIPGRVGVYVSAR